MFSILSRRCPLLDTFLSVLFCLLSMLISDSRFDLVWLRLSCDHGWIRSGSVNVRKQQQQQQQLMEYQHRLSKGQRDLGLYKNDPFEIKLKEDVKTPIVSRSYRYNPVVAKEADALRKLPMPNIVSELRSLLGGLSYYRKFLPNLSRRLQPITRLLRNNVPFSFNAEMEALVRGILKVLTKPPVPVYPDFEAARDGSRKFRLYCDASAAGFGATLE